MPFAYKYDNQIELVIQYDSHSQRDEVGFKFKV